MAALVTKEAEDAMAAYVEATERAGDLPLYDDETAARVLATVDAPEAPQLRAAALLLALRASEIDQTVTPGRAQPLFEEADQAAEAAGNLHAQALVRMLYADIHVVARGSLEEARRRHLEALEISEALDDRGLQAVALVGCGMSHHALGRLTDCLAFAEQGIALVEHSPDTGAELLEYSPYVAHLYLRGIALLQLGRLEESGREFERALKLATSRDEPVPTGQMYDGLVVRAYFTGSSEGVLEYAREATRLGERTGIERIRGFGTKDRAIAYFLEEDWERAAAVLSSWLEEGARGILPVFHPICLAVLARATARAGDPVEAVELAQRADRLARSAGMEFVAGITKHALGESLRLAHGQAAREQAEAAHRSALASVERTGGRALLPLIRWDQAMLARRLGRRNDEDQRLREALDLAENMGAYGYAARIREQQASKAAAGGPAAPS